MLKFTICRSLLPLVELTWCARDLTSYTIGLSIHGIIKCVPSAYDVSFRPTARLYTIARWPPSTLNREWYNPYETAPRPRMPWMAPLAACAFTFDAAFCMILLYTLRRRKRRRLSQQQTTSRVCVFFTTRDDKREESRECMYFDERRRVTKPIALSSFTHTP